ncbi:RNA polymerase Rbp10 [Candidatus Bathyarchaeota archaeon]|nr:RNA polymerase Rbp10 [Candidatus Bathyarchaeota archaeon]
MSKDETPSSENSKETAGIQYECVSCGTKVSAEQLAVTPEIKCPICGYRILKKARPPIVRHLKAR